MPSILQPGRSEVPRCGQGGQRSVTTAGIRPRPTIRTVQSGTAFRVTGVTYGPSGAILPGATVDLYSESRVWMARTISDGAGAFTFEQVNVGAVFLVAYLEGAPEVAGTTIHNVTPTQV